MAIRAGGRAREKLKWSDVADRRLEINTKERQYKSSDDASGAAEPDPGERERSDTGGREGGPEPNLSPLKKENRAGPTLHEMAASDNHFRAVKP